MVHRGSHLPLALNDPIGQNAGMEPAAPWERIVGYGILCAAFVLTGGFCLWYLLVCFFPA
jgi:hypothetical protein